MTDIHQHVLWGMDDGAADAQIMQRMLREAASQGITKVAATCHVCPGMEPFDSGVYQERLMQAREFCQQQGLPLEVLPGAEVAWTYQTVSALRQGRIPTLGNTEYVLLELWRDISLAEARRAVQSLISAGYCPVLAHVERYRCFSWFPRQALKFRAETGALFQINADTYLHPRTGTEKRFIRTLMNARGADAIATDAHGMEGRPLNLRQAYAKLSQVFDGDYVRQLLTFADRI